MQPKSILVVDDETQMVDMGQMRLEASGYEIITAYDGQEGLEKAKNENPDLIIFDIMMPKMDGYEACSTSLPKFLMSGKNSLRSWRRDELPQKIITKSTDNYSNVS